MIWGILKQCVEVKLLAVIKLVKSTWKLMKTGNGILFIPALHVISIYWHFFFIWNFGFLGYTSQCSMLTPDLMLRSHSWQVARYWMWCQESNPGQSCIRQVHYILYYGPLTFSYAKCYALNCVYYSLSLLWVQFLKHPNIVHMA